MGYEESVARIEQKLTIAPTEPELSFMVARAVHGGGVKWQSRCDEARQLHPKVVNPNSEFSHNL